MSDEEDYMSDAFIATLSKAAPAPGLVTVKSIARQRATEDKVKKSTLPKGQYEARAREEGLSKQVDPNNKGFGLLMKMGYKPGQGLGKNAAGRAEPVPIQIPEGRAGLGLSSAKQEKRNAIERLRNQIMQAQNEQYRSAMAERYKLSRVRGQLNAIRNICFQLDTEKQIPVPISPLFWPPPPKRDEEVVSESDDPAHSKKRRLELEQPIGHPVAVLPPSDSDEGSNDSFSDSAVDEENPEELLEKIVRYVRRKHHFCFWCSIQYDCAEALDAQCPGPLEPDHD